MKNYLLFFTLFFCLFGCKKDTTDLLMVGDFQFEEVTGLPDPIDESSGLEVLDNGLFLSFNDKGGEAALYEFGMDGVITRTINLSNGQNKDWEDITQDVAGNIFIGDFGNNDNDRQDLVIYKINQSDFATATTSVEADRINFSFPDQTAFPPPESEKLFDVEAMFTKEDFLYLLTKDRTSPFLGITNLYRLPKIAGTHDAVFMGQFMTDNDEGKGKITAADLSPDEKTLAIISDEKIWLFQNVQGDDFFNGDLLELDLPVQYDMEGVVFRDDCIIYLSNEAKSNAPAILYEISLCQ